ncbi:hypothetical protein Ciccas_011275 [Cichlidogyrus casuarinus]|uniref:Uncharacterized protein n=1 Tax=Cichlidogyrus casuarinus TaxID=1844966 RepID=A0ABD2PRQ7_9PLAT
MQMRSLASSTRAQSYSAISARNQLTDKNFAILVAPVRLEIKLCTKLECLLSQARNRILSHAEDAADPSPDRDDSDYFASSFTAVWDL